MSLNLTLISRSYCHLCEEMEAALRPMIEGKGVSLTVIDVDADVDLEARYGDLVPVLLAGARELCHYFLDACAVREVLEGVPAGKADPSFDK